MRIRKGIFLTLLLITSLVLVACGGGSSNGNEDETPDLEDELTVSDLKEGLKGLKDNYELNVNILIYDELEAKVEILVDGNKSSYKEGEFVEFYYIREGQRDLTVIEKKGDTYVKSDNRDRKDRDFDIFNLIDENWFEVKGKNFELKADHKEDLLNLFNLSDEITLIKSTMKLNDEGNLSEFNVTFEENRDTYYLNIEIKNINNVSISIPEVR